MKEKWHSLDAGACLEALSSSANGLTEQEAAKRLERHGFNELKEAPKKSVLAMLAEQFASFLILLLVLASAVAALLGEWLDAGAIIAVVILNAVIGFIQEYRAEEAIAALKKMVLLKAKVRRNGETKAIDAKLLVQGDVILLAEGDKVPADARLIESFNLEAEESALTGESAPSEKNAKRLVKEGAMVGDRQNMVFLGTAVTRGTARAVIVSTGMATELGRIAELVESTQEEETPLQKKLAELGKRLGLAALAICGFIFVFGVLVGIPALDMFMTSVSLAVAAVPEGLPAVVTIALALGVQRMAKRKSIVRRLPAVETLGSTTVICTDKTGTLTTGEMTVREVYVDGRTVEVGGAGYGLEGGFTSGGKTVSPLSSKAFHALLETCAVCNSSDLAQEKGRTDAVGDPTEASLLVLAAKAGLDYRKERREKELRQEIPFDSKRKMMTVVRLAGGKSRAYVKGAPEVVVNRCRRALVNGRFIAFDRKGLLEKNREMAARSLRVLALAFKESKGGPEEENLVFLGLVGMNDPPRPEAKTAVQACRDAAIRVVMITGDHPETAKAIGKELGITGAVVSGAELDKLSEAELERKVEIIRIYARVSPEHKLRIVSALKKGGHVVAMTGDGVNDAPAIKKADIGVAMGLTGTDVTKEASDMVVTDDNFATIFNAVEEGRTIFDNIVKAVTYLISCNIGEIMAVFAGLLLFMKSPLAPLQILWMNLVTDSLPAIALSVEPSAPDVMRRPPRPPKEEVFGGEMAGKALAVGAYMAAGALLLYWLYLPAGAKTASTAAFSTLVIFQLFFALTSRSLKHHLGRIGFFSNKFMLAAVAVGAVLQFTVVQAGLLEPVFDTVPLTMEQWAAVLIVSASLSVAIEVKRRLKN